MRIDNGRNQKLFSGEWVFSDCEKMAYKLDKEGSLIFNCSEEATKEEKLEFTIGALIHMGVDKSKARDIAETMGPI